MRRMVVVAAALAALLALGGCGRGAHGGASGGGDAGPTDRAKLNAYTEGYNIVLGEHGLRSQIENYDRGRINTSHPEPVDVMLTSRWLDQARTKLQAGRAMPTGSLEEVDAAVDRFLPALDKVMAHETQLSSYYTSKAWQDDHLARGKREDPVLRAEFATALAQGDRLEKALTGVRDARETADLDRMKASGDMLGYHTQLALHQARALVGSFSGEADLHDPRKIAAANVQAAALEKTLADQHAEVLKAEAKPNSTGGSPDMPVYRVPILGETSNALDVMLGHYRDLRAGGGADAYRAMVASYNSAIGLSNAMVMTQ